jgi:hypothetical protein
MPALSPLVAATLLDLHFAQSSVGQAPGQAPGLRGSRGPVGERSSPFLRPFNV